MSDNLIYEVTQMAKSLEEHQKSVVKNPPREVQLMRAMKAFMPEERHAHADRIIDMMLLMSTFENTQAEIKNSHAPMLTTRSQVHPDGVYEIDETCMTKNKGFGNTMMLAIAMSGLLK